jgi:Tol biopolymer transport system component
LRAVVATLAVGVTAGVWPTPPVPFVTIAQHDVYRSTLDGPSVSISADGRFVALISYARLVQADTNGGPDLYVLDRAHDRVTLESPESDGTADLRHPSMSGDGRFVAFDADAAVMLVDRDQGTTRVIAHGSGPSISSNGRFVVFTSHGEIYRFDLSTGATLCLTINSSGAGSPSVSADGRYVAFAASAPVGNGTAGSIVKGVAVYRTLSQIYVVDAQTMTTTQLMVGGRLPNGDTWAPAISADGRFLAFVSAASNLVSGDRNRASDVFLTDLRGGATELVSRSAKGGSGNGASNRPAVSGDGSVVVFQSIASDLVCAAHCSPAVEDINLLSDIFLFHRSSGAMSRLSSDSTGGWMEESEGPALDDAAGVIAFSSRHPTGTSDTKNDFDLFVTKGSDRRH